MASQVDYRRAWAEHRGWMVALAVIVLVGLALAVVGAVSESPLPFGGMLIALIIEISVLRRLSRQVPRRSDGR